MSVLTTHTSNQFREKRKRKEMNKKLRQVIKSQTKLPTPQGEAKGLDTIGKRAQLKFRQKRAPKCMNASSP
jgi:hypothetical protein